MSYALSLCSLPSKHISLYIRNRIKNSEKKTPRCHAHILKQRCLCAFSPVFRLCSLSLLLFKSLSLVLSFSRSPPVMSFSSLSPVLSLCSLSFVFALTTSPHQLSFPFLLTQLLYKKCMNM